MENETFDDLLSFNITNNGSDELDYYNNAMYPYRIPSDDMNLIPFIFSGILAVLGFCGNSMVLFVYWGKRQKSTTDLFIITLAAVDLIGSAFQVPVQIYQEDHLYVTESVIECILVYFLFYFLFMMALFTLCEIAVDRYFAICQPHKLLLNPRRVMIIIGITTGVSGVFGVAPIGGCVSEIKISDAVPDYICMFCLTVSIFIIIVLYSLIFYAVKRQAKAHSVRKKYPKLPTSRAETSTATTMLTNQAEGNGRVDGGNKTNNINLSPTSRNKAADENLLSVTEFSVSATSRDGSNVEINRKKVHKRSARSIRQWKTAIMLLTVNIIFLLAYSPHLALLLITLFKVKQNLPMWVIFLMMNTVHISYAANPIVYAVMSKRFRDECNCVVKRLRKICRK